MGQILASLSLLKELVDGMKTIVAFIQANQNEAWFQLSGDALAKLRDAKNDDERRAVAQDILKLWASLPK